MNNWGHTPPGECPHCGGNNANRLVSVFVGAVNDDGELCESLVKRHRRFCDDCAYQMFMAFAATLDRGSR